MQPPLFAGWMSLTRRSSSCRHFIAASAASQGGLGFTIPTKTRDSRSRINGFRLRAEPSEIYRAYFGFAGKRSRHIVILSPRRSDERGPREEQDELPTVIPHLCPKELIVRMGPDPGDATCFPVRVNQDCRTLESGEVVGAQGCPYCGSEEGVFFIGSQAATISSVAIDELLGSALNTDPKLLAFTDSVQDASHRAGFFTARTYHFTLRTGLKHIVDEAGDDGMP